MAGAVLGLAVALCAAFSFGLSWPFALLLYFAVRGFAERIVVNDGRGLAKYGLVLLLFPLVMEASSIASAKVLEFASPKGAHFGEIEKQVATGLVGVLVFIAATGFCSVVAGFFGNFSLPRAIHVPVAYAAEALSRIMVFIAGVLLVRYCDRNLIEIANPIKVALSLVLGIGMLISLRRLFTRGLPTQGGGSAPAEGGQQVAKSKTKGARLSDVIGMDDAKEQIRLRLIEPVRNPGRAKKYGLSVGGGVLLYGPPGTGKTMLARAVAGELNLPFFMITAADVFGKYVGDSERNIRKIFADARKAPLSVVFIDELETLFPNRSADVHETTRKVISVILQEMDGLDKSKNPILLLGATNVPWMVDEAFLRPGRFDIKIFVGLPDEQARHKMLAMAFARGRVPLEDGLLKFMAARTKNYSGADLNGVIDRLRQLAYAANARKYTRELAEKAIASISPTANGETLDKIQDWEAQSLPSNSRNSGSGGVRIAEKPNVTLADVAGMTSVKDEIRLRLIDPLRHATLADMYGLHAGGGMLLYGPPGTGKTFLARAVAGELELPFFSITPADVFGKYVGESERNIKKIFRDIRKNDLSVVFMDELETMFPKRTSDVHETTRKVISLLLQELDGVDGERNPILLIGATNVPWMVDEAFLRPGRFDVCLYVGPPDLDARRHMVCHALESGKVPFEEGLDKYIAERTEGYTGADLKGVMERMRQFAFKNRLRNYTRQIADEVLGGYPPSRNGELVANIRRWEASRGLAPVEALPPAPPDPSSFAEAVNRLWRAESMKS